MRFYCYVQSYDEHYSLLECTSMFAHTLGKLWSQLICFVCFVRPKCPLSLECSLSVPYCLFALEDASGKGSAAILPGFPPFSPQLEPMDGMSPEEYRSHIHRAISKGHNFETRVSISHPAEEGGDSLKQVLMVQWWSGSGPKGLAGQDPIVAVPPGLPQPFHLQTPR
jgi:hypothetical protein